MVNEQGGVGGRMIDFISLDDGYSPPKTVEQVRRLVEQDQVAFLFQNLGTPCNSAIAEYLNHKKIPQLFVGSGASKWSDNKKYPWTMGFQPGYRTEAQIYAKHMLANVKDAEARRSSIRTTTSVRTIRPACATSWATTGTRSSSRPPATRPPIRRSICRSSRRRVRAPTCCWLRRSPSSPRSRSARCTTSTGSRRST